MEPIRLDSSLYCYVSPGTGAVMVRSPHDRGSGWVAAPAGKPPRILASSLCQSIAHPQPRVAGRPGRTGRGGSWIGDGMVFPYQGWSVTRTMTLSWTPATHSCGAPWCGTSHQGVRPRPGTSLASPARRPAGLEKEAELVIACRHSRSGPLFHRSAPSAPAGDEPQILVPRVAASLIPSVDRDHAACGRPARALRTKAGLDHRSPSGQGAA